MKVQGEVGSQQTPESRSSDRGRDNGVGVCTENVGLRILIIDDMKTFLTMIDNGLKKLGQTVFVAPSGQEGIRILEANPIDVVVCDLGMEEMDGWEVAHAVREICEVRGIPKIPFVLLTGWGAEVDDDGRLAGSNVSMVLKKPVEISGLLQCLRELVGRGWADNGTPQR